MDMQFWEIILTSLALSADAFAVSVSIGMGTGGLLKNAFRAGIWFGAFQGIMPLIGFLIGRSAAVFIESIDHWLAFILLFAVGANMIREALKNEPQTGYDTGRKEMLTLAVATSIDALAAGMGLAFAGGNMALIPSAIAAVTFIMSFAGVYIGKFFGSKLCSHAQKAAGAALILIGAKILFEHLLTGAGN